MTSRVTSARLVGREDELASLESALADAASGRPSVAFLAGDSGVGKTRLVTELSERAAEGGALVLAGDCVEIGNGEIPYAPIVGALRPLARAGDPAFDALGVRARGELARLLPLLGAPGVAEGPADGANRENAGAAQARLFEALLALLDRLGASTPVLLAIEDLHWADRSTRAFLAFLSGSLRRERVLVVATYRADELHRRHPLRPLLAELGAHAAGAGAGATPVRRIQLPPLTRAELAVALEGILGAPPADDLVERLFARSEGNPLFMEELLAADVDGRGALPDTLRDALMVRIERLSESAQELLRVLAVGQQLDHRLLADAGELEPAALRAALREAVASHLVVAAHDGSHAFRHALLREVVEDDLLPGERTELHLALARALERRLAEGVPDPAAAGQIAAGVAHHYAAAGEQRAALAASVRAGRSAEAMHAYGAAAAQFERALELWERVPGAEELAGLTRIEVLTHAAEAHHLGGDRTRPEPLLRAALEDVDPAVDPRPAAALLARLAQAQWRLGRGEEALNTARRGLDLVPAGDRSPERAALLSWWARARMLQSRFRESVIAARDALAVAEAVGDDVSASGALNALGVSLMAGGAHDEGIEALHRAQDLARAAGRSSELESATLNLAEALHLAGRTREGLAMARETVAAGGGASCASDCLALMLGELAFEAGEWDEAARWFGPSDRRHVGTDILNAHLRRAELALGLGDHATAATELAEAEMLAPNCSEPQLLGPLGVLTAELRRRQGDLDGAREAIDVALDRIEFCSDDAMRLARVAAAGVAVEADAAQRGIDLGDDADAGAAVARADALLDRVRAAAGGGRPVEQAWLTHAGADAARASGDDDPAAWRAAARAWEILERPYLTALARWREAAAHAAREDRTAAATAAGAALETARRLGAGWLSGEIEGLSARARLRVDARDDAPSVDAAEAPAADEPFGLTPRERQVLALVARGATNREIGGELYMAEKTASVHVSRILAKLDVRTRTQAAAVAHRLGLAEPA